MRARELRTAQAEGPQVEDAVTPTAVRGRGRPRPYGGAVPRTPGDGVPPEHGDAVLRSRGDAVLRSRSDAVLRSRGDAVPRPDHRDAPHPRHCSCDVASAVGAQPAAPAHVPSTPASVPRESTTPAPAIDRPAGPPPRPRSGFRAAVLPSALALLALALPACGDDARGPAAPHAQPTGPVRGTAPPPRAGQGALTPDAAADVAAEAAFRDLVAAWENADDSAANDRAVAAILASGRDGAARLVRWLADGDENQRDSARELIPLIGLDAVPALADMAARPGAGRGPAVSLLERLAPLWRGSELGPDVCRALVACLGDRDSEDAADALKRARPAISAVVSELVDLWRATWDDDDASDAGAVEILVAAGPDARAAAAAAIDALECYDGTERCVNGGRLLAAIGATTPADLARLVALLDVPPLEDSAWDRREDVLTVLASWGDAAGSAAPKIAAFLDAGFPTNVRIAAAEALAAMPGATRSILGTTAPFAWDDDEDSRLAFVLRHAVLAQAGPDELMHVVASIPASRLASAAGWIDARAEDAAPDERALLDRAADAARARMAASTDASLRMRALTPWIREDERLASSPPAWLAALLDDADVTVRAHAAYAAAVSGAAEPDRIFDVAALIASDPASHGGAVAALGRITGREPRALAALVAILDDTTSGDPLRYSAAREVGRDSSPIAGRHAEAITFLTRAALESPAPHDATRALLRFEGGLSAFLDAIRRALGPPPGRIAAEASDRIVAAVSAAGPKAEPLRDALIAWGGAPAQRALDALRGGGAEILRNGGDDEATFRRLLAAGPDARGWVAAFAAGLDWPTPKWLGPAVASAGIDAEVLAAAQGRIDGIPAKTQVEGAIVLAPFLAPRPAADALMAALASDPSQFADIVWELTLVARRDPAVVPPDFVASLLRTADEHDNVRDRIYALAAALGRRAAPLVPILRERRKIDRPLDAVWSAVVLFQATGDPEEAMVAIRPLLERPDRGSVFVPWEAVGDVLTTVPLSKADRTLVLGALPRATFAAPRTAIVRALGALGAEAAPLVPSLRAILSEEFGGAGSRDDEVELGIATCRVLGGLGAAARPAIPDLRRWIALTIDADGTTDAGVAAIRAIEGAR